MIQTFWQRWNSFWFGSVPLLNLALFRIVFAGTMTLMYIARHKDLSLFYTDAGILPKDLAFRVLPQGFRPPVMLSFWPDAWVSPLHTFFVLLLFLLTIGFFSRPVALMASYFQLAFVFRNYGVAFGADQIGSILLLYLAFTQSDARLSVRAWLRNRQNKPELQGDIVTSLFYRMVQIQLCIIYVYSGMEKLKGGTWWDGTAVWSVMANSQMVIADFTWLRHLPLSIVFVSFTTILFELYFPVLVWVAPLRKYFLAAGLLFHASIGILMALWSFALVMMSTYLLFLPEGQAQAWLDRLCLKVRQRRSPESVSH